jgi:hypothetical protein
MNVDNLSSLAAQLSNGNPPIQIKYKKDGKFFRVLKKEWELKVFEHEQTSKASKYEISKLQSEVSFFFIVF